MSPRAGILCLVALLASAPAAAASTSPDVRAYRVLQSLRLDEGQTGTYTLACRDGDLATDGSWLVDDVATNPQLDDEPYDLVTGVDVLEASSFAPGGYTFTVRNNAEDAAQVRIGVTCLDARAGRHRLRLSSPRTAIATLEAGRDAPEPISCPRGSVAVAPGFALGAPATSPRLTTRAPTSSSARRIESAFTTLDTATVRTSARCLQTRTSRAGGHRHRLKTTLRVGSTDVNDGRVETFTVSCRSGEHPIVGTFRLGGSWYLGQSPAGRQRAFKLQSPANGSAGDAVLGLLCLRLSL